ncbi:hypothetical protein MUK42_17702 [Musa troglodytarum]|uniref:Uncharacterized protein n=1 Tax=Musa troglodytarum TaxID=320322 RepID=A0A9E7L5P6_9LILI|nr:hypothetical protein MUK42_17702 [Musa troglodytarum]
MASDLRPYSRSFLNSRFHHSNAMPNAHDLLALLSAGQPYGRLATNASDHKRCMELVTRSQGSQATDDLCLLRRSSSLAYRGFCHCRG